MRIGRRCMQRFGACGGLSQVCDFANHPSWHAASRGWRADRNLPTKWARTLVTPRWIELRARRPTPCLLKAVALSLWKVFMNPELDPWLQLDLAPREDEDDDGDSYEGEDDDFAYEEGDYEEEEESDEEEPSHDPFGEDDEDLDDDESDSDDEG